MDVIYSRLEVIGFVKLAVDLTEDTLSTIIAFIVCKLHDYESRYIESGRDESRYYDSSPFH